MTISLATLREMPLDVMPLSEMNLSIIVVNKVTLCRMTLYLTIFAIVTLLEFFSSLSEFLIHFSVKMNGRLSSTTVSRMTLRRVVTRQNDDKPSNTQRNDI